MDGWLAEKIPTGEEATVMHTMAPTIVLLLDSQGRLISVRSALPPPSAPQFRHIPPSPMLRQLSLLPSHQMLSLSHWLTVRQMQRLFRRHRKPRPLRWIRISRPPLGLLHPRLLPLLMPLQLRAKTPTRRQRAVDDAPGLPATDSLFCVFSFTFSLPV